MERFNEERLKYLINDFNSLAEKAGVQSRLKYTKKDGKFTLYLGRKEQFAYGTHQCELCNGAINTVIKCTSAMIKVMCFERHIP